MEPHGDKNSNRSDIHFYIERKEFTYEYIF